MQMVSVLRLPRRNSWTTGQTHVRGRRMPSSSMERQGSRGGLLMAGGVRDGVGLLHACLTACWPAAPVLSLYPLPLPRVSSGLLVLPVAVCAACSYQHWLLVKRTEPLTFPVPSASALRVFWAAGTACCCLYCSFLPTLAIN